MSNAKHTPGLAYLDRELSRIFRASKPKQADAQRRFREKAKALAEAHGIEIEKLRDGGMNVWPPKAIADTPHDPFEGDHYADDWEAACGMCEQYAAIAKAKGE